jgi:hypothetical protein
MTPFLYELGLTGKDKITGFTGVLTSRVQCLTGCNQYHLQPTEIKDNKYPSGVYFDEHRIEILPTPKVTLEKSTPEQRNGCDVPMPDRG